MLSPLIRKAEGRSLCISVNFGSPDQQHLQVGLAEEEPSETCPSSAVSSFRSPLNANKCFHRIHYILSVTLTAFLQSHLDSDVPRAPSPGFAGLLPTRLRVTTLPSTLLIARDTCSCSVHLFELLLTQLSPSTSMTPVQYAAGCASSPALRLEGQSSTSPPPRLSTCRLTFIVQILWMLTSLHIGTAYERSWSI